MAGHQARPLLHSDHNCFHLIDPQDRRPLRGPDKKALIVAFGDIMASRNLEIRRSFDLRLSFNEAPKSGWSIGPTRKSRIYLTPWLSIGGLAKLMLGISPPHGIVPISGYLLLDFLACSIPF